MFTVLVFAMQPAASDSRAVYVQASCWRMIITNDRISVGTLQPYWYQSLIPSREGNPWRGFSRSILDTI